MSNFSLLGETSSSMSDLSGGRGPASLHKPSYKSTLPGDALHYAVWHGKTSDIKKIVLDGGVNVEINNCHGQTPLFVAAYIQNYFSVKTLLQLGANPNGRCIAGYTPTHAACFSGSRKILIKILEFGGDLRLHDENQCTPIDWALWQSDGEKKLRIMELIDSARRCTMKQSGKDALVEKQFSRNIGGRASLTTLFKRKLPVKGGKNGNQEVDMGELVKNIHAMGFGKMYFGNGMKAAAISTIPYIEASDLSPDRHHPTYSSGSFTEMSSKLWLHTRVTVRSLLEPPPAGALVDILISELEALCKLTHPQILLLMGVCQTKNYEGLMLVFEHVQLGSLYYCLHEKNCMPKIKSAVDIIIQIVDALVYLHSHGWLHCSLTSHAVHLVGPNVAKLSSFELAVENREETRRNRTLDLLSDKGWQSIYNWLCPDVLKGEPPSKIGDLYSLCCLIWEISTGQVPWGNLDPDEILIEIKLKGHSLPLDKKYIPKHLVTVLEQGLKLRGDERDVNLHEIRDMLILTRKNAVKNEKKRQTETQLRSNASYAHRDSSTTDSGVWFGSGSQPVRSYSSSAIHRSPQSSHSSQSYNHYYNHHSAEEDDEDDESSRKEDVDEFTGLRKTSSILKRKKYEKTFGKIPSKTFSASHQDVDCNYDYVKNRAKRHFLRNGCVSKNDYVRETSDKSEEDLRRRSLSSLYHATLCASDKDNGIDLLSSSEHSNSSCDLSPYYSGDSLTGEIVTTHLEKRRIGSPDAGMLRSRSVPRTNSSTIPVSNSAAEFVAAHLQEANKRGYGRTFSNLSQKSRENLDEEIKDIKLPLPPFKGTRHNSNKSNDIRPASHATQRSPVTPTRVTRSPSKAPIHSNKKDLVSSMSKLNLHLPVLAVTKPTGAATASAIYKNKSASSIRSPLGIFKEAYQSRDKKSEVGKSKSMAALPKFTAIRPHNEPRSVDADAIRVVESVSIGEQFSKSEVPNSRSGVTLGRFPFKISEDDASKAKSVSDSSNSKSGQHTVLIHSTSGPKRKSVSDLKVSNTTGTQETSQQHWRTSRKLSGKKSFSVGSLRSSWESKVASSSERAITSSGVHQQQINVTKSTSETSKKEGFAVASLVDKYSRKQQHNSVQTSELKGEGNSESRPYTLESKILGTEGFVVQKVKPHILKTFNRKGPNPNAIIYSNTRSKGQQHNEFKCHYSSVSDRKPSGGDIVRSGDRISSPPRSEWSTKGVQNLIQSLESIQQQKNLERQQQIQSTSLYQTASSELYLTSNRSCGPILTNEEPKGPNGLGGENNDVKSNEDNLDNNLIQLNDGYSADTQQVEAPNNDIWNNNLSQNDIHYNNFNYGNEPCNFPNNNDPLNNNNNNNNNNFGEGMEYNQQPLQPDGNNQPLYQDESHSQNILGDLETPLIHAQPTSTVNEDHQRPNEEVNNAGVVDTNYQWNAPFTAESGPFSQPNNEVCPYNQFTNNNDACLENQFASNNNEVSSNVWNTVNEGPGPVGYDETNQNNIWNNNNDNDQSSLDVNLTQAKLDTTEMNNNTDNFSSNENPSSQSAPPLQDIHLSSSSTPHQSPILKSSETSPTQKRKNQAFALRTSTPNDYKSHQIHRTLQSAYSTAMAEAVEEEEGSGSSECWNSVDCDLINFQADSGIKSSSMVRRMDKKLARKSSQKQGRQDSVDNKREQNNVTFNSEVLEISNSVCAYTQTPDADMPSRRTSASSSFLSQEDTEDLYCDDELNPSLENDPNMQLTISRSHLQGTQDDSDFPQNPMFNDQDSILSMDIPSTGPTSLRSELSEDKDAYNTASSEEEENSVSGDMEVEIASENARNDSEEQFTTVSSEYP